VSASLEWNVSQLSPLIRLFSQIETEPTEIRDLAERAGCKAKGNIPRRDTADSQWQEVMRNAINEEYLDKLIQEIRSKALGKLGEDLEARLQEVVALRLVNLVGADYAKLKDALASLLDAQELDGQLDAAVNMRKIVLSLLRELDDTISWQALTPIETSKDEINKRRETLVLMCVNIIGAADYMISLVGLMRSTGVPSDPKDVRMYLAGREDVKGNSADRDEKQRRMIDSRNTLFLQARQLWFALKENVTLSPAGN
jgi:hypothetical protein